MTHSESDSHNHTEENSDSKSHIEKRLREAGVDAKRFIDLRDGAKVPAQKRWRDDGCGRHADEISGNFAIKCGEGLIILDVDHPDQFEYDLPETYTVRSPHAGYHLYYVVRDETRSGKEDWGELQAEGSYVVGADSKVDHENYCRPDKENCPGQGISEYTVVTDKSIATLSSEDIENLRDTGDSSDEGGASEAYGGEKIILSDDALADQGERYICTEFMRHSTQLAEEDLMDFLRGGTGSYRLQRDDQTGIDQSAADFYTLEILYGAFLYRGEDEEDARRLALAVFKRYCRENPYDKTGNLRKWLRKGERYIQEQMDAVEQGFDFDKWHRWRRRKYEGGFDADEQMPWTDPNTDGIPSLITQDTVRATLHILTGDFEPEYVARRYGLDTSSLPSTNCGEMFPPVSGITSPDSQRYPVAREVGEAAAKINPEREASYFAEVVKRFSRETREVAHAYCPSRPNGERHVYYIEGLPDPDDARWVKVGGEERDPELEETEPEVMTDGGTPRLKGKYDIVVSKKRTSAGRNH